MTEDEVVGWHHQLKGHAFAQTPRDGEGQGRLVCCSPWGRKDSDMTEHLTNNDEGRFGLAESLQLCTDLFFKRKGNSL